MKHGIEAAIIVGDDANGVEPPKKRMGGEEDTEMAIINEMNKQQQIIDKLDNDCAKEQMVIQQKYDEKKKPIFEERQKLIDKIPGFWGRAIITACELSHEDYHDDDKVILSHLEKVELDDNLDPNGSYRLTFTFNDSVKEFFEPTVLTKYVKFTREGDEYEESCESTTTEIQWKEGKKPDAPKPPKDSDEDEEHEEMYCESSVIEWFSSDASKSPLGMPDFGEMIRRQVIHQPQHYYVQEDVDDDGDDDEDGDEDAAADKEKDK